MFTHILVILLSVLVCMITSVIIIRISIKNNYKKHYTMYWINGTSPLIARIYHCTRNIINMINDRDDTIDSVQGVILYLGEDYHNFVCAYNEFTDYSLNNIIDNKITSLVSKVFNDVNDIIILYGETTNNLINSIDVLEEDNENLFTFYKNYKSELMKSIL